jgi:hypothetical protein
MEIVRCKCCRRRLTNSISKSLEIGSECRKAFSTGIQAAGCAFEQVETIAQKGIEQAAKGNPKITHKINALARAAYVGDAYFSKKFYDEAVELVAQLPAQPIASPAPAVEANPEIVIQIATWNHGSSWGYEFRSPFRHLAFLAEFETKVGRPFRCWNAFKNCWVLEPKYLRPAEFDGLIEMVAEILARHFRGHAVRIDRVMADKVAA